MVVRTLIDKVGTIKDLDSIVDIQIDLCEDCIAWCVKQERKFLRQQIEVRLGSYYLQAKNYPKALKLINTLVRDVKKVDDKHLLVEVHLIESRIQHSLQNIPKAKAALTASRAAASSIYVGPLLHAEIDMQAGSLHSEERDYKTAYSYFYEAFEGFDGLKGISTVFFSYICFRLFMDFCDMCLCEKFVENSIFFDSGRYELCPCGCVRVCIYL